MSQHSIAYLGWGIDLGSINDSDFYDNFLKVRKSLGINEIYENEKTADHIDIIENKIKPLGLSIEYQYSYDAESFVLVINKSIKASSEDPTEIDFKNLEKILKDKELTNAIKTLESISNIYDQKPGWILWSMFG